MTETAPRLSQTKTARLARERLRRALAGLEEDADLWATVQETAPEAWGTLEQDLDLPEKRVKITLRLDASVAAFFRGTGPNYGERINRVLATWAQMQIGEVRRETERLTRERALAERRAELGRIIAAGEAVKERIWKALRSQGVPEEEIAALQAETERGVGE